MTTRFYGINIDRPLSTSLGSSKTEWNQTTLGQLYARNNQVYLKELPFHHRSAQFAWRVVDAYWSPEDSTITIFRAYDLDGKFLADASFGVTWGSCPHKISTGDFEYQPEQGGQYYVPVGNQFVTPNTGGYAVQVLDKNWPSEALAFGIAKGDTIAHQALVISFRLFPLGPDYPGG